MGVFDKFKHNRADAIKTRFNPGRNENWDWNSLVTEIESVTSANTTQGTANFNRIVQAETKSACMCAALASAFSKESWEEAKAAWADGIGTCCD